MEAMWNANTTTTPATIAHANDDAPRPLSGRGASQQTRRLQLRNQGFRAAVVPARKVTPTSMSSSAWSAIGGLQSSDAENVSPTGLRTDVSGAERRRSSGILQEVGNATFIKPRKRRPRVEQTPAAIDALAAAAPSTSPPPPPPPPSSLTLRPQSVKHRVKMSHKRRSASAEAGQYIEHLEAELAAAQSRLSSVTSPTVARAHSAKLRELKVETKYLQDEVASWEAKFNERLQDAVQQHYEAEAALRSRIRALESDVEEANDRIRELETSLLCTAQNSAAVETANVNLEKRLEIMSELLAASPTKIDLHSETPGLRRHRERPKSMLPRFPTASALVMSPERYPQPQTQPPSPLTHFASFCPSRPTSSGGDRANIASSASPSDAVSDAESVFSETPLTGEGVHTADAFPPFHPWAIPPKPFAPTRPTRRMRRFGAGSIGPKPLILPATSYCDVMPTSAPPLERRETAPVLPFTTDLQPQARDESPISLASRRRASTIAGTMERFHVSNPDLTIDRPHDASLAETEAALYLESTEIGNMSHREFSSFGSAVGRNLMDELTAARSEDSPDETNPGHGAVDKPCILLHPDTETLSADKAAQDATPSEQSTPRDMSPSTAPFEPQTPLLKPTTPHRRCHSQSKSRSISTPFAPWQRLHALIAHRWRTSVQLARHLVQHAQARMHIPGPLRDVQWWLVCVLLGPMARRRMLASAAPCAAPAGEEDEQRPLLHRASADPPPRSVDGSTANPYGPLDHTPPSSPPHAAHAGNAAMSGKGKKRTATLAMKPERCQCQQRNRARYSPWLWLKFSLTLAFAVGVAFTDGPGSLLKAVGCACQRGERRGRSGDMHRESCARG